jgi:hypothetical protein
MRMTRKSDGLTGDMKTTPLRALPNQPMSHASKPTVANYREFKEYPKIVSAVSRILARQRFVAPGRAPLQPHQGQPHPATAPIPCPRSQSQAIHHRLSAQRPPPPLLPQRRAENRRSLFHTPGSGRETQSLRRTGCRDDCARQEERIRTRRPAYRMTAHISSCMRSAGESDPDDTRILRLPRTFKCVWASGREEAKGIPPPLST